MQSIKESFSKITTNKLLLKIIISISIVVIAVIVMSIWSYLNNQNKQETQKAEFSAVNEICELATLRCYYHDVAEYEKESNGLFNYGYKKFWIEYDGIVEMGIDVGKVQVHEPDTNGIVKIYVPEAKILNINADPKSMNETISDTGVFTKITIEEKSEAFSQAQITMKNNAKADSTILLQAHNNAKKLLEQYVITIGEQSGKNYTVEWVDNPTDEETQKTE